MENKFDDAIKEAFLKSAIKEAAAQDIAEIEAMTEEVPAFTDKQRREIERAIRREERRGTGAAVFRRAVAMFFAVFAVAFALLMTQPTVRASVIDTVVSFFEKYVLFAFNDEPRVSYAIGDYTITYIPEGYELVSENDTPFKVTRFFSNGENEVGIYWYKTPFNKANMDEKILSEKEEKIGELSGYHMYDSENDLNKLVWGDESHTLMVSGQVSEKEIVKIAQNIK